MESRRGRPWTQMCKGKRAARAEEKRSGKQKGGHSPAWKSTSTQRDTNRQHAGSAESGKKREEKLDRHEDEGGKAMKRGARGRRASNEPTMRGREAAVSGRYCSGMESEKRGMGRLALRRERREVGATRAVCGVMERHR
ncbi:hypothetical protein K438DRAFT_1780597 [Mycena galopus ATCC 62051]|nr:hypothetical protein K438DRAFT_1780597 [Mycena galopus ATCC 62051]